MTLRLKMSAVLFGAAAATICVAAPGAAVPAVPASPGSNCVAGYMTDPNSGNCWQTVGNGSPTIGGGPCMPGRIGTCLGYLANNPFAPGDTLPANNNW